MSLLIGIFVGLPAYLLGSVVMPELTALQQTYSHMDETADRIIQMR